MSSPPERKVTLINNVTLQTHIRKHVRFALVFLLICFSHEHLYGNFRTVEGGLQWPHTNLRSCSSCLREIRSAINSPPRVCSSLTANAVRGQPVIRAMYPLMVDLHRPFLHTSRATGQTGTTCSRFMHSSRAQGTCWVAGRGRRAPLTWDLWCLAVIRRKASKASNVSLSAARGRIHRCGAAVVITILRHSRGSQRHHSNTFTVPRQGITTTLGEAKGQ